MLNEKLYGKGMVGAIVPPSRGPLNDRHIIPPFSTWNTREEFWQNRKRKWLNWCGIKSEEGREDALTYNIPLLLKDGRTGNKIENQTSIFDPMLTELAYTWWCPPGYTPEWEPIRPAPVVLDPFAGGSVRGIVASMLGLKYYGIELRAEQVEANRAQISPANTGPYKPRWVTGDSLEQTPLAPAADFILSCPPYGPLEKYSDDPRDISNMTYEQFLEPYTAIIHHALDKLKDDSFAVWVVGNFREAATGKMHDFVGDTVRAFESGGAAFYNDIILINSVGSGAMRANTSFVRGCRKVVKLHQNVLVFIKGDAKAAAAKLAALAT